MPKGTLDPVESSLLHDDEADAAIRVLLSLQQDRPSRAVGALGQSVADAVDRERDAVRACGGALVAARPHHPQGLLEARPRRLPARDGVDGALLL